MNWKILLTVILFVSSINLFAQETEPAKPSAKFYGYINWETIFDSHESVTTRDGELYLYPSVPNEDPDGNDLNKNAQLEMLALQTRVGAKIDGGNVLGAKLTGVIEGDFFATGEAYKRHLRMRHAFMKLKWDNASLLMGQYWHPMFGTDVFPGIIQFGAGVIYNPLNRAPQIRFDYNVMDDLRLTFAALEHGYHASVGPEDAQRNAGIPDLQFQATYGSKDNFLTGITAGYLVLKPREDLAGGYINEETINSYNLQWFGRIKLSDLTLLAKASYGTNMSQFVMLGGYGRLLDDAGNNDEFGYTTYKIASYWFDGNYKINENLNAGLFFGYTQNMGTVDKVDPNNITARGSNIMSVYRVAPRISYSVGPLMFALEYAYNSAAYGEGNIANPNDADEYGIYDKTENSTNNRIIFAAKFTF